MKKKKERGKKELKILGNGVDSYSTSYLVKVIVFNTSPRGCLYSAANDLQT